MESNTLTIATIKRKALTTMLSTTDQTNINVLSAKYGKIYSNRNDEQKEQIKNELINSIKEQCKIITIYTAEKSKLALSKKDRLTSIIDENQSEFFSNSLYFDNIGYLNELTDVELHYLTLKYDDFTFAIDANMTEKLVNDSLKKRFELVNLTSYADMSLSVNSIDRKQQKKNKKVKKILKVDKIKEECNVQSLKFDHFKGDRKLFFIQMLFSSNIIRVNNTMFPLNNKNDYVLRIVSHINYMLSMYRNDPIIFMMLYSYPIMACSQYNSLMTVPDLLFDRINSTKKDIEEDQVIIQDTGVLLFVSMMNKLFKRAIETKVKLSYPTKFLNYVRFWVRVCPKSLSMLHQYVNDVFPKPESRIERSMKLVLYAMCDIKFDQLDRRSKAFINDTEIVTFINDRSIKTSAYTTKHDDVVSQLSKNILDELFEIQVSWDEIKNIMYEEYVKQRPEGALSMQQTFVDLQTTDDESSNSEKNEISEKVKSTTSAEILLYDSPEVSDAESDSEIEEDLNELMQKYKELGAKRAKEIELMRNQESKSVSIETETICDSPPDSEKSYDTNAFNNIDLATDVLRQQYLDCDDDINSDTDDESDNEDVSIEECKTANDMAAIDNLLHGKSKDEEKEEELDEPELTDDESGIESVCVSDNENVFISNNDCATYDIIESSNTDGTCFWSSLFILMEGKKDDCAANNMRKRIYDAFKNDDDFYYNVQVIAQANALPYHLRDVDMVEQIEDMIIGNEWVDQNIYPIASVFLQKNLHIIDESNKVIRHDIKQTYPMSEWMVNKNGSHYEPVMNVGNIDNYKLVSYAMTSYIVEPVDDQIILRPKKHDQHTNSVPRKSLESISEDKEIIKSKNNNENILPSVPNDHINTVTSGVKVDTLNNINDTESSQDEYTDKNKPMASWAQEMVTLTIDKSEIDGFTLSVPNISAEGVSLITVEQVNRIKECSENTINAVNILVGKLNDCRMEKLEYNAKLDDVIAQFNLQKNEHKETMNAINKRFDNMAEEFKIQLKNKDDTIIELENTNEELKKNNNDKDVIISSERCRSAGFEIQITELTTQIDALKEELVTLQDSLKYKNVANNTYDDVTKEDFVKRWIPPIPFSKPRLSNEDIDYLTHIRQAVNDYCAGITTQFDYDEYLEDVEHIAHGVQNAVVKNEPFPILYSNHIVTPFNSQLGNYVVLKKRCPCGNVKHITDWLKQGYITMGDGILQNEMICQCMVKPATLKDLIIWGDQHQYMRDLIDVVTSDYV